MDVDKAIATSVKTGKVVFGANEAKRSVRAGKARLVVVSSNNPPEIREDLEYYGKASTIPVVTYKGNSFDLGRICGKRFPVSTLTVKEPGDSEIMKLVEQYQESQEGVEEKVKEL
ncbi:MAG: 50S ribosomal protein L30e [Candidatus Bathyarchaeota archaeon]|nr:MAG: 50S ribosomal protein L30e [Candidatus Bathyarchaeota archaeon]